jgi:hypothetical protein
MYVRVEWKCSFGGPRSLCSSPLWELKAERCTDVRKMYLAEYHTKNKARILAYKQQYRAAHKEARREYNKQYHQTHRAKILSYKKQYHKANKDKRLQYNKLYQLNNKEKKREQNKRYEATHKLQRKEYNKRQDKVNKREYNQKYNKTRKSHKPGILLALLSCSPEALATNSWKTEEVRNFFESVSDKLHIATHRDWYRISTKQIIALGGKFTFKIFSQS